MLYLLHSIRLPLSTCSPRFSTMLCPGRTPPAPAPPRPGDPSTAGGGRKGTAASGAPRPLAWPRPGAKRDLDRRLAAPRKRPRADPRRAASGSISKVSQGADACPAYRGALLAAAQGAGQPSGPSPVLGHGLALLCPLALASAAWPPCLPARPSVPKAVNGANALPPARRTSGQWKLSSSDLAPLSRPLRPADT